MEKGQDYSTFLRSDRTDENRVIFSGYLLEILIPASYFDLGIACINGTKLETIGIFNFRVKMTEHSKFENYSMNTPNELVLGFDDSITGKIDTKEIESTQDEDDESDEPTKKEDIEDFEDDSNEEDNNSFYIFSLNNGTTFLESTKIVQSSKNVEKFIKLLYAGKIPKMSYTDIYRYHAQVELENSTPLGIPANTRAAIIAELCRSKRDKSIPFRLTLNKSGVNKNTDFKLISIKSLPDIISTFSGLSFENVNKSLTYAIDNEKNGKPEVITPIEKIVLSK